jgi:ElaB/YqjD/DUF883 family membrane-anchored ribosome-binding protein
MDAEMNKYENPNPNTMGEHDDAVATAQNTLKRGAEAFGHAKEAVSDVYDKTAHAVSETYSKAKSYTDENPHKTIFIALGIGVGLGFILGAHSSHHSRTSRLAEPVVNALSNIALEFLR